MVVAIKIKNPKAGNSKAARVTGLAHYIKAPHASNASEKCIYFGARNFLSEKFSSQISEMVALATDCVKSKDPIRHDVISFKEHEVPALAQVEEIMDLYLQEMNLVGHQVFYGLHADTDDMHIHVQVNRVHPQSSKAIKTDRGFDKEALQRLCARIAHTQGWQTEPNSRYWILADGSMSDRPSRGDRTEPRSHVQAMEMRTGTKSAERIVMDDATPLLRSAKSWRDLHTALAAVGIRYERHGSGACMRLGDLAVKASVVTRDVRFAALQKRLGPFEEFGPRLLAQVQANYDAGQDPIGAMPDSGQHSSSVAIDSSAEPLQVAQASGGWRAYATARAEHYKARRLDTNDLRKRHAGERQALQLAHKTDREACFARHEYRAGLTNTLRKLLAFEHAKAKLDLKDKHARERSALKSRYPQFAPSYEDWLRAHGHSAMAEQWRYRANPSGQKNKICGSGTARPLTKVFTNDIRNFRAEVDGWKIRYLPINGHGAGFIDKGRVVLVLSQDNATVLAALQLAAQKWPAGYEVSGSAEFIDQCCRLAAKHGLMITNPELQDLIEVERKRVPNVLEAELIAQQFLPYNPNEIESFRPNSRDCY
jgi:hypothetical protein